MKRLLFILLSLLIVSGMFACSNQEARPAAPTEPVPTESQTEAPTAEPTAQPTQAPDITPIYEQTEPAEAQDSYIGALTDEQKEDILAFAADWYKENFEYEVLSIDFAEDDDPGYAYYSDRKPGELIILKVATTHGGPDYPRDCFITVSDEGYNVINEGY